MVSSKRKHFDEGAGISNTAHQTGKAKKRKPEIQRKKTSEPAGALLSGVALSGRDKAPEISLSPDQLTCIGQGGYRMIRATHGVHSGLYFWEAEILKPLKITSSTAHIRLGWSTRQGHLQAPVGYDKWSFGYRDINGSKVHDGIRDDIYGESFGPGDIIGCCINLDDGAPENNQIRFFKNGKDQGIAFRGIEIAQGIYYPAISLYNAASVRVNFGPSFILKHDIYGANAISELQPLSPEDRKIHEKLISQIRQDIIDRQGRISSSSDDVSASAI